MIRDEIHKKDNSLCPDAGDLELRGSVTKFHENLFQIYDYKTHPLPSICRQAIWLAIFAYSIASGIAQQPCEDISTISFFTVNSIFKIFIYKVQPTFETLIT